MLPFSLANPIATTKPLYSRMSLAKTKQKEYGSTLFSLEAATARSLGLLRASVVAQQPDASRGDNRICVRPSRQRRIAVSCLAKGHSSTLKKIYSVASTQGGEFQQQVRWCGNAKCVCKKLNGQPFTDEEANIDGIVCHFSFECAGLTASGELPVSTVGITTSGMCFFKSHGRRRTDPSSTEREKKHYAESGGDNEFDRIRNASFVRGQNRPYDRGCDIGFPSRKGLAVECFSNLSRQDYDRRGHCYQAPYQLPKTRKLSEVDGGENHRFKLEIREGVSRDVQASVFYPDIGERVTEMARRYMTWMELVSRVK